MKRILFAIFLALLILLVRPNEASAQSAFNEMIGDVPVPVNVSMNVQAEWQGYIIYSVRIVNGNYVCVLARDGEPHQFPIRTVTFSSSWELLSDSGLQEVKKPEPPKVEPPKEEPKPEPVQPEPPKPEKPEKPEKPDPPVVKPPEEEPPEEPEEPEESD